MEKKDIRSPFTSFKAKMDYFDKLDKAAVEEAEKAIGPFYCCRGTRPKPAPAQHITTLRMYGQDTVGMEFPTAKPIEKEILRELRRNYVSKYDDK